jgi:hypothetical protein
MIVAGVLANCRGDSDVDLARKIVDALGPTKNLDEWGQLIKVLRAKGGYWYMATPYSKYIAGMERAFEHAAATAARFIAEGVSVFSPIAHSHHIAEFEGLDPLDHGTWMRIDKPLMEGAIGLLVVTMDGWEGSKGVGDEIEYFTCADKPIYYVGEI